MKHENRANETNEAFEQGNNKNKNKVKMKTLDAQKERQSEPHRTVG